MLKLVCEIYVACVKEKSPFYVNFWDGQTAFKRWMNELLQIQVLQIFSN